MVAQFTQCFFVLEYVLNPLAVYAGNKLLFLIAFYLFFRKPLLLNLFILLPEIHILGRKREAYKKTEEKREKKLFQM